MNDVHLPAEVLAALAVILLVARASGALARRLGQPAVIGEITAGLALGPSLLGLLPGDLPNALFPTPTRPVLGAIAQLGLVLFMFLIGLEADTSLVRGQARMALTVSLSSIALPFALGVPLAIVLHSTHNTGAASDIVPFVLFIGASLSITAFPVLARILTERQMDRTPLGTLALATASLDDVIAWSLLAVVVAIVVSGGPMGAVGVALGAVAFTAVLALVGRPLLRRLLRRTDGRTLSSGTFALILVGVLAAAWTTDRIGVHLVFGAFAFGVLFPNDPALREAVAQRVEAVTVLLLPVFFVVTGLNVDLSRVTSGGLGELALILAVAVGGKVGGAFLAARLHGLDGRRSLALGLLANTRGLTELVILGIGRQLGVLDAELFGLLVVMALVTTAMAGPLLDVVYPRRLVQADLAMAERAAAGAMTVVAALPEPARPADPAPSWGSLLAVAGGLARSAHRGHVLLSRVLPLPGDLGVGALGLLAAEVDTVSRAGRDLAAGPVTATPNVVRARDPHAEVRHQLHRVEADWLVTAAGADGVGTRRPGGGEDDEPGADVVLVVAGPAPAAGPILLVSNDPAAWEVAARLALARGEVLEVRARGAKHLVDAARRLGLDTRTTSDDPPGHGLGNGLGRLGDGPGDGRVAGGGPSVVVSGPGTSADLRADGGLESRLDGSPAPTVVTVVPAGPRARHGLAERAARVPARDLTPTRTLIEEPS